MRVRVDLDPKNVLKVDGRRRKSRKCRMSKNDFLGMSKWLLWSQIRLTPWCRVSSFQPVLRLLVSPQIHLSLETFAAEVAAERFVSGVFPAVRNEVGALAERLPAHLAFVWLFTWKRKKNKNTFDLGFKKYIYNKNKREVYIWLLKNWILRTDLLPRLQNNQNNKCSFVPFFAHLCGWRCVSSCPTSDGTFCRSTGMGTAACRSG